MSIPSIRHLAGPRGSADDARLHAPGQGRDGTSDRTSRNTDRSPGRARQRQPDGNGATRGSEHRELMQKSGGGAGNRTRVREASSQLSFTCVVGLPNRRGPANSVVEPSSRFSRPRRPEHRRDPALVMTPFRYQNYLSVGRLHCFLCSESDCIVVCNWYGPILERVGCLHTQTNLRSPRRNRSPPRG